MTLPCKVRPSCRLPSLTWAGATPLVCSDRSNPDAPEGTVYLLHFEHPYNGPMQHYVGFTTSDLDQRLKDHRAGNRGRDYTTRV